MTRADIARRTLAAALVCCAAASAWWRLLGAPATLGRIIPAIVLVAVCFAAGTAGGKKVSRGLGAVLGLVGTLLASLIFAAMTLPDADGSLSPGSVISSLVKGLGLLLHSPVPAPVNSETVGTAIVFSGYATVIACLLVCSSIPASMLAPAVLLFTGATALSSGSLISPIPSAFVLAIAALGALAMVPNGGKTGSITDGVEFAEPEHAPRKGVLLLGMSVGILSAIVAIAAINLSSFVSIADARPPYDPHQQSEYNPQTPVQPILQVNRWQTTERGNPIPLFATEGNNLPVAFTWAIVEAYNGRDWQTNKTFSNTDGVIPYSGPEPEYTRSAGAIVDTTDRIPGPWLPVPYRPTEVTLTAIRSNPEGVVIARSEDARNVTYNVGASILALPDLKLLSTVEPADPDAYSTTRFLVPGFPDTLKNFAAAAMKGAKNPDDALNQLASRLASAPFSEDAAATTRNDLFTYDTIEEMVMRTHRGTQAQFATAFALMARSQGYATRLVAGYAVKGKVHSDVVSTDAMVWPEVNLTAVGWVPFAPGPKDLARGVPVPVKYVAPPAPAPTPEPTSSPQPEPEPESSGISPVVLALVAILIGAGGWLLAVAGLRRRLRGRLHAGSADLAPAAGAWAWLRLARAHVAASVPSSPQSVIDDLSASPQLRTAAAIAQTSLYSPADANASETAAAWTAADADVAAVVSAGGANARLRWLLVPIKRNRAAPADLADQADQAGEPVSTGS